MLTFLAFVAVSIEDGADLVVRLLALAIVPLTTYVGRTRGQRAVLPIVASIALTMATAVVDGSVDLLDPSTFGLWLELGLVTVFGYFGLSRPLGKAFAAPGTNQGVDAKRAVKG